MKRMTFILLIAAVTVITATSAIMLNRSPVRDEIVFKKGDSYEDAWKKVTKFETDGLPKSALEMVEQIYKRAKQENNYAQVAKSIMYKMKYVLQTEDGGMVSAINQLKAEADSALFPLKPMLQSLLGEFYWYYYSQNRYVIYQRTNTGSYKPDDIATWDARRLIEESVTCYRASVASLDSLQRVRIDLFDDILETNKNGRKYRPMLFDFLAFRAFDFFSNSEADIVRPSYEFSMNDAMLFSDEGDFAVYPLVTSDTFSLKYLALGVMQQLIASHTGDKDATVLVDADLKRLDFVNRNSIIDEKDSLYTVALMHLKEKYRNQPFYAEIVCRLGEHYLSMGETYQPVINEKHQYKIREALTLAEEGMKTNPGTDGAANCLALKNRILSKNFSFTVEKNQLPDKPVLAKIEYKNVDTMYFRVIKIDWLNDWKKTRYMYDSTFVKYYLKMPVVKSFAVALPDSGDYQAYTSEIEIPSLPLGYYIIIASHKKNFKWAKNAFNTSFINVTNLSYLSRRDKKENMDFIVMERDKGNAVQGVTATVWKEQYSYVKQDYDYVRGGTYTTDENGKFRVPSPSDYRYYFVELKKGSDNYISDETFYQYRYYGYDRQKYYRIFFFTDRSIYRPGQTLHFKGIIINTDDKEHSIVPGYTTTVTLYDVNYQKVSDVTLKSNEYGSIQGTFEIPAGLLNGTMSISAGGMGTHYISVEEYKRPKFEVAFDTLKETYRLNDKVTVNGQAKAYAGSAVDNAKVSYRVTRQTYFPYRWWYWWYYPAMGTEKVISFGEVVTDAEGKYSIDFNAIPDKTVSDRYSPAFIYSVTADVTDINGETRSAKTSVNIGYKSLVISSDWADKVNAAEKREIAISATNLNGNPVDAKGQITIYKLKSPPQVFVSRPWPSPEVLTISEKEFRTKFPDFPYKNENNPVTWDKERKVFSTSFNTSVSKKIEIADIEKWEPGSYYIEIVSKDKYGETVNSENYITLYHPVSPVVCASEAAYFIPVKSMGEPGDTASFIIGSALPGVIVLYEIELNAAIVKSEWVELKNEQKLIKIPVSENHRGNFSVHFSQVTKNRPFLNNAMVVVPFTNKELDISFASFRNKLLPGEDEEWKVIVKGKKGDKVAAEMVATLYDASLDAFKPHGWSFSLYPGNYTSLYWNQGQSFAQRPSAMYQTNWNDFTYYAQRVYDKLNMFGLHNFIYYYGSYFGWDEGIVLAGAVSEDREMSKKDANERTSVSLPSTGAVSQTVDCDKVSDAETRSNDQSGSMDNRNIDGKDISGQNGLASVQARSNFAETAFFYPQLNTSENGEIIITFKVPEALTRWKMLGMAHTKDLRTGTITNELVTQKDLMVTPNLPRFIRENDVITLTAKIANTGDTELNGLAQLFLTDALTEKPVDIIFGNKQASKSFTVKNGQSENVSWEITVPEGVEALSCKIVAMAGKMSDGEVTVIPVLTNRMLVTESMPLPIRDAGTKNFTFTKLINSSSSKTISHKKLTLEFTANPAWYAVQALPYIMEYPYECAEQVFSRYYGNKLASFIANSSPKIKAVFDSWKNTPGSQALLSNLEKNQELKEVLLQETPWVLEGKDETARKRRIGLLFDLNLMANNVNSAFRKLEKLQCSNGGFVWFPGMPDDRYITQHIATGFGHLNKLGVIDFSKDNQAWNMMQRAVKYLDNEMRKDYDWMKKHYTKEEMEKDRLWELHIQYLYMRSFYNGRLEISSSNKEAYQYFMGQARKYWLSKNRYSQGMIALALHRFDDKTIPPKIIASLKENSMTNEEMGMYWKENSGGYYWWQAPIETQALLIEAFDEVTGNQKDVDDMKVWLLKQKQTQDWRTTKATTEAIYALLLKGTDWLATEPNVEITVGNIKVDPKNMPDQKAEAGTGYIKTSWTGSDIKPEMGNVKVSKKDAGVSWGALYWQYFEQLDKITPHETPLKLSKKLFIERFGEKGKTLEEVKENSQIKVGDKVIVRIELRVDRKMEYVHMKDMRASGFEPLNVISTYKWQDGLGYYESTKDASTNFFFGVLPLGTYVFEYPLRATLAGNFSNGITTIQCMYAPEFTSHSEGIRVKIK